MASVVGIGAAVFDILMTVDAFPREDTKLRGLETKFQCGGPCATGLVAISKLGESASYMGTVGDDMYGTFVKAEMERYGVDTSCVKVNPGLTFHSVVLLNVSNSTDGAPNIKKSERAERIGHIVEKYGGQVSFECPDGKIFTAKIMLKSPVSSIK